MPPPSEVAIIPPGQPALEGDRRDLDVGDDVLAGRRRGALEPERVAAVAATTYSFCPSTMGVSVTRSLRTLVTWPGPSLVLAGGGLR